MDDLHPEGCQHCMSSLVSFCTVYLPVPLGSSRSHAGINSWTCHRLWSSSPFTTQRRHQLFATAAQKCLPAVPQLHTTDSFRSRSAYVARHSHRQLLKASQKSLPVTSRQHASERPHSLTPYIAQQCHHLLIHVSEAHDHFTCKACF